MLARHRHHPRLGREFANDTCACCNLRRKSVALGLQRAPSRARHTLQPVCDIRKAPAHFSSGLWVCQTSTSLYAGARAMIGTSHVAFLTSAFGHPASTCEGAARGQLSPFAVPPCYGGSVCKSCFRNPYNGFVRQSTGRQVDQFDSPVGEAVQKERPGSTAGTAAVPCLSVSLWFELSLGKTHETHESPEEPPDCPEPCPGRSSNIVILIDWLCVWGTKWH